MASLAVLEGESYDDYKYQDLLGFSLKKAWRKTKRLTKKAVKAPITINRKIAQKVIGKKNYRKLSRSRLNPVRAAGFLARKAKSYTRRLVVKQVKKAVRGKSVEAIKAAKNTIITTVTAAATAAGTAAFPGVGSAVVGAAAGSIAKVTLDGIIKSMERAAKRKLRSVARRVKRKIPSSIRRSMRKKITRKKRTFKPSTPPPGFDVSRFRPSPRKKPITRNIVPMTKPVKPPQPQEKKLPGWAIPAAIAAAAAAFLV